MAKGDILNKLKIAGYVTSTDPSDWIEDELDIQEGGGSATFPECIPASSNGVIMGLDYVTTDDSNYSIESGSWAFKHNDEIVKVDLEELDDTLSEIDESTLTLYDSYSMDGATIKAYDLPEELSVLSSFDPNKAGDVHYFETLDNFCKIWGLWDGGNKDELIGTYIPKLLDQGNTIDQYVFYRVHEVQDPTPFINKLHVGFYTKDQQSPCLTKLINIILETSPDDTH